MLIVLEGLDGAGKSTQVKRLADYLRQECGSLDFIHFPRYEAPVYGDLIGRFLRGAFGHIDQVHPQLVALLYAEDRHGAAPAIRKTLEGGGTVLMDRYVYSNIAYQCAKLEDPGERNRLRNWILETEFGVFGEPEPDLNLFLDVPIDFVAQRLAAGRNGHDRDYLAGGQDIHEADIRFQVRVREEYLRLCAGDAHLRRIDCAGADGAMASPDVVFDRVRAVVDEYLHR